MAEPLKNQFGPEVPATLAAMLAPVAPRFDREAFMAEALDGYEALELTPRAWHIARALRPQLPADAAEALDVIVRSLGPELEESGLSGMGVFVYLPFVFFVAEFGLDHFEASMTAQYELTKRFTAEFSIRAFLDAHPEATLTRLAEWTTDPNAHVRRLVSEGTRPRLPWAPRLQRFVADPTPVLGLLEKLKDDPALYVRRSVANNLNDIAKDHPELVIEVCSRWRHGAGTERMWVIRHGLRTLVKQGHEEALAVLGFVSGSPVVTTVALGSPVVTIGTKQTVDVAVFNPAAGSHAVAVDLRLHFVKANGSTSPKVFKGAALELAGGESARFRRTISLAQHTTRTHHPGRHLVELLVNGENRPGASFEVVASE